MVTKSLHEQVAATLERLRELHPELKDELEDAYGYVVFPSVGRAAAVVGVSFGRGIVFERGRPIGVATISELTIGVQLGGQTFTELLLFRDPAALEKLKNGDFAFAANASAVLVKAAASGTADFHGVTAKAYAHGGMLLELSIGGQKISFEPLDAAQTERTSAEGQESNADGGVNAEAGEANTDGGVNAEAGEADADAGKHRRRSLGDHVNAFLQRVESARLPAAVKQRVGALRRRFAQVYAPLADEQRVHTLVHRESQAALAKLLEQHPMLRDRIARAAGVAVFPSMGKASAVLGAAYGRGEVFERGSLIGYAALVQLTVGLQLGGETFSEIIIFDDDDALERFKRGRVAFAANAAAVIVKAGVATTNDYATGGSVHLASEGGMLLEAALGGQKVVYRSAVLTRGDSLQAEQPAS